MSDIIVKNGILKWEGGGCRTATDPEKDMWGEIERLREALREYENSDNWFDTSDEAGGPYPAWRGPSPHDPEGIASRALEGGGEDE